MSTSSVFDFRFALWHHVCLHEIQEHEPSHSRKAASSRSTVATALKVNKPMHSVVSPETMEVQLLPVAPKQIEPKRILSESVAAGRILCSSHPQVHFCNILGASLEFIISCAFLSAHSTGYGSCGSRLHNCSQLAVNV